ncbi:MAG: bifunctional metallophosphatase/5'-nucleotidase [Elusimicrobia bacterium]|nr:bifunctional metallophosphatase/5'-nucleotidase [Elusimicrobiota bacterium]
MEKKNKNFYYSTLYALRSTLFIVFIALCNNGCANENRRLVIYHTGDIHGHISSRPAIFYKQNPERLIGGFAALAAFVKKDGSAPSLLLDSGDLFFASPEGNLTKGESVVALANAVGFSAAALGNHEFDFGEKQLAELAKKIKFPFLGANVVRRYAKKGDSPYPDYALPCAVRQAGGLKIGMIGLATPSTPLVTLPRHVQRLKFLRPVNTAKPLVERLRSEGCDLIIVLSHIGWAKENEDFEDDKYLAKNVPGIDIILGGHSHTRLEKPYQDPDNKTLILHSGFYLTSVGRLELEIGPDKKIKKFSHRLADLWVDETGEDQEMLDISRPFKEAVDKKLSEVVGQAEAEFLPDRNSESSLGNLISDVMRLRAKADAAFQNPGGIREALPAGPIAMRQLYTTLPFDNTIVTLEMTGGQIKEILETSLADEKGKLQISGIRLRYNPAHPKGHRLTQALIGGKPILITKNYLVATNNFLADGGDGYSAFLRGAERRDLGVSLRDAVADWIRLESPIAPKTDGRLTSE